MVNIRDQLKIFRRGLTGPDGVNKNQAEKMGLQRLP